MTFNALGQKVKGEDKTLAEKLGIEMPVEKPEKLEAKVYTENLKEIVVELNDAELADKAKLEDVNNYKLVGNKVDKATLDGNKVVLELNESLLNNRKNNELVIRNIDKAINGKHTFVSEDNTVPVIEKVEVLGEYGIKVITSEPVKKPAERNFLIDGKNVAMIVEQYGREIVLSPYHNRSFLENAKELTIEPLFDYAGFKSVEVKEPIEIVKDDVAPEVVEAVSTANTVEVTFNKDVYRKSVAKGNIYYELGRHKVNAIAANKVDTNKVVYVFDQELPRRLDVVISGVANHSNVKMEEVTVATIHKVDYTEPEIIDSKVVRVDEGEVELELYFDKDVYSTFSNKELEDNRNLEGFIKSEDDHFTLYKKEVKAANEVLFGVKRANFKGNRRDVVIVSFDDLEEGTKYVLEIKDFTDRTALRNRMYRDYVEFTVPEGTDELLIRNIIVKTDRNNDVEEIEVRFNGYVNREIAENANNYIFTLKSGEIKDLEELGGKVIVENDGVTVTLVLSGAVRKNELKGLEFAKAIKDIDGNRLAGPVKYNFIGYFEGLMNFVNEAKEAAKKYNLSTEKLGKAVREGYNPTVVEEELIALEKQIARAKGAVSEQIAKAKKELNYEIAQAERLYNKVKSVETNEVNDLFVAIAKAKEVSANSKATLKQIQTFDNNGKLNGGIRFTLAQKVKDVEDHVEAGIDLKVKNATVKKNGMFYEVTPNKDIKEITIETNLEANIKVQKGIALEKVIVDAQNAHVEIPTGVELKEVEVKSISYYSLEINGKVEKLVVSTSRPVNVYGKVNNMVVETTVDKAVVKVSTGNDKTPTEVVVEKDKPVEVKVVGEEVKAEKLTEDQIGKIEAAKALEALIAEAKAKITEENKETESAKKLQTAIDAAKKELEKEDATVQSLKDAKIALELAVATYNKEAVDEAKEAEAKEALTAAIKEVPTVTAESDLSAIAAAMKATDKIKAADDALTAAKELGVTDETIKAIKGYSDYIATKTLVEGIKKEEGIVNYNAVLNTDHTDESIKDHYFIKVTVTGNLNSSNVSAIYSVDSEKDLNPDADTVLWFKVASKDDTKTPLHEDGTYTYLVKTKGEDSKIYSFTHEFKFENVEFPKVEQ